MPHAQPGPNSRCHSPHHSPRHSPHRLVAHTHRSLAKGCGKRFKKGVARWCCSTCDFDLCDACSLDVVTEEADLAAAAADEAIRKIEEAEAEAEAAAAAATAEEEDEEKEYEFSLTFS